MNTEGNSATIHWCPDCGKSLHSCKMGIPQIPCFILRKLVTKVELFYNKLWVDESLMPDDVHTYVVNKMWDIKYAKKQRYSFNVITMAISFVIYTDYEPDSGITVEQMFEFKTTTIGVNRLVNTIDFMRRKMRGFEKGLIRKY